MRELNVNYDTTAIAKAFAGTDKLDRLSDKLEELINNDHRNPNRTIVQTIQTGVELYADTVEEAIGIALLISDSVHNFYGGRRKNENPLQSMLRAISAGKGNKETNTIEAIAQGFGSVKNYMARQPCEECSTNGQCPTQSMADMDDITWREGRKLE